MNMVPQPCCCCGTRRNGDPAFHASFCCDDAGPRQQARQRGCCLCLWNVVWTVGLVLLQWIFSNVNFVILTLRITSRDYVVHHLQHALQGYALSQKWLCMPQFTLEVQGVGVVYAVQTLSCELGHFLKTQIPIECCQGQAAVLRCHAAPEQPPADIAAERETERCFTSLA